MIFKNYEKQAILRLLSWMAIADGDVSAIEDRLFIAFMHKLGVTNSDILASKCMSDSKACSIARGLSFEQKRLVGALLASMMLVDGKVDGKEVLALTAICVKCDIPVLNPGQAQAVLARCL